MLHNTGDNKNIGGLHLGTVNIVFILIAVLMAIFMIYNDYMVSDSYNAMQDANERYVVCKQAADNIIAGSDELTRNAREFVVTGNYENIEAYFTEVKETCRRENGEKILAAYASNNNLMWYMTHAIDSSNVLYDRECYAFRLAVEGLGYDLSQYPEEIRSVSLIDADKALSQAEKLNLARDMLFDDVYSSVKDNISTNIDEYLVELKSYTDVDQENTYNDFLRFRAFQRILTVFMVVMIVAEVIVITMMIVNPIQTSISFINKQQKIPTAGFREIKMLAVSYNNIFEKNRVKTEQLNYEATHDSLTRVNNRAVFEELYKSKNTTEKMAVVMVDIDRFKNMNDKYGHDIGDRILQSVAQLLQSCFRSDDCICRIGGDEFVVILYNVTEHSKILLQNKYNFIKTRLANPEDGLPPVGISVGAAFGSEKYTMKELHKNADVALYQVKNNGRGDIGFFEEE